MVKIELVPAAAALLGLAAMGATLVVQNQTQQDMKLLATEIVQLKEANKLLMQQVGGGADEPPAAAPAVDPQEVTQLGDCLSALEAAVEAQTVAAAVSPAPTLGAPVVDPMATSAIGTGGADEGGECIPAGTTFLVATGDSYPICGTGQSVTIAAVGMDQVVLDNGTTINITGSAAFADSCRISVNSVSEGFARLRVIC